MKVDALDISFGRNVNRHCRRCRPDQATKEKVAVLR
jgi:hypothetical protein